MSKILTSEEVKFYEELAEPDSIPAQLIATLRATERERDEARKALADIDGVSHDGEEVHKILVAFYGLKKESSNG